jgi:phage tail tape-measure protein
MTGIGTWETASGTSEAHLQLESDDGDVTATELPSWVADALKGAVAGGATGAAGGPVGALVGAATGAAIGAASSAGKPAQSASASAAGTADRARIVQALQQFAAVVPALVQLVAASGVARKETTGDAAESFESANGADWGPESFQGTWTTP